MTPAFCIENSHTRRPDFGIFGFLHRNDFGALYLRISSPDLYAGTLDGTTQVAVKVLKVNEMVADAACARQLLEKELLSHRVYIRCFSSLLSFVVACGVLRGVCVCVLCLYLCCVVCCVVCVREYS